MTCIKHVQKHIWKEHLCALQVFLCVLVSRPMCVLIDSGLFIVPSNSLPSFKTLTIIFWFTLITLALDCVEMLQKQRHPQSDKSATGIVKGGFGG